jgi:beta-lactamase regulating signal transducer with metallopeptidase domain
MEHLLQAASPVSAAAISALFSAIWEGFVLAVCVLVCLRLLPRLSAASRSVVWMNVFLLLVLLHMVPPFREHLGIGSPMHASPVHLDLRWSIALAGLWAMLSVWRGTQLILSAIRLRRLANRATPVPPDPAHLALLKSGQGGRAAELCTSVEVERPGVFGFFRPRILVPPALVERLSALELRQVVLHEMEHLRRGDDWTNLRQKIGLAFFPLNPVLLWVERRLCAERELACDDQVLRSGGARKAYAVCLTRLAEYSIVQHSLSLILGAWERQPELVRRVHRLLRRPHESMGGRQATLVTASLLLGVLGGAITLARSPQIVSFAPLAQATVQAWSVQPAGPGETDLRQFGGSRQLVKAVMSQRPVLSTYTAKPVRSNARKQSVRQRYAQSEQEWVVLAAWSDIESLPHQVFTVAQWNRASYAAIPIENGWLIVQI